MWKAVKEFFTITEEELKELLREAEEKADKYMKKAEKAEKEGDPYSAKYYDELFMSEMNNIKSIRKQLERY